MAAWRSSSESFTFFTLSRNSARLIAYLATSAVRFLSRLIMLVLAMQKSSTAQRETERHEQRPRFRVGLGAGGDGDVHSADRIDLVEIDLGENDLLLDAERIIAASVERARRQTAEVADARNRDTDQAIQEFIHAFSAQRHLATDRPVLAHLEIGNRFARAGDLGLLATDLRHVVDGVVDHLFIG